MFYKQRVRYPRFHCVLCASTVTVHCTYSDTRYTTVFWPRTIAKFGSLKLTVLPKANPYLTLRIDPAQALALNNQYERAFIGAFGFPLQAIYARVAYPIYFDLLCVKSSHQQVRLLSPFVPYHVPTYYDTSHITVFSPRPVNWLAILSGMPNKQKERALFNLWFLRHALKLVPEQSSVPAYLRTAVQPFESHSKKYPFRYRRF